MEYPLWPLKKLIMLKPCAASRRLNRRLLLLPLLGMLSLGTDIIQIKPERAL